MIHRWGAWDMDTIQFMPVVESRTVRIVDRSLWGKGPYPNIVSVTVDWECPVCGGPRGEPHGYNFYEDGDTYHCDTWYNDCGHIDRYDAVLKEARDRQEYADATL